MSWTNETAVLVRDADATPLNGPERMSRKRGGEPPARRTYSATNAAGINAAEVARRTAMEGNTEASQAYGVACKAGDSVRVAVRTVGGTLTAATLACWVHTAASGWCRVPELDVVVSETVASGAGYASANTGSIRGSCRVQYVVNNDAAGTLTGADIIEEVAS